MPYDIPKLTENPFVLISGFVLVITAVLIAVVLSRYAAEAYKGNRKKATLFFVGITAFVTLMLFCFFGCAATTVKGIYEMKAAEQPPVCVWRRSSDGKL